MIPRRTRVSFAVGMIFAFVFALLVTPAAMAERWLGALGIGTVVKDQPAPLTVRIPAFTGFEGPERDLRGGGVVIARGELATADDAATAESIASTQPRGALPYVAFFVLVLVFGTIFAHHMRRSTYGRLVRVQLVSLLAIALFAGVVKVLLLGTVTAVLIVPIALFAMLPTLVLDRVVGLTTGILAALVVSLLGPFDLGIAILMLVQAATAGLVVAERPRHHWRSALLAGGITTLFTFATYVLLTYLTTGAMPAFGGDLLHSPWLAAAIGPGIATLLTVPLLPLYQLAVGEVTQSKLVDLEDLSNPLLKQIAGRSPGTWQHSLAMANMAEIAANSIGANGRLVRVGAYYHDLGKSLQPKYFIENLEPGEVSPHDQLPPEVSCDAIFAHVTEGIVHARKAGLHERIVDFMHMHHGNGVLEYFWGRVKEQGNPRNFSVEDFRYPGHPPQTRETAILAICDAVEAASRTLKSPTPASIESLVQRIVYGKLHLGQLDESGLSMSDLRCVSDSLRETIRHANHGRIEYPWQKAQQDASASPVTASKPTNDTSQVLRLDSLDRRPVRQTASTAAEPSASMSMPIELGPLNRKSQDLTRPADRVSDPELSEPDISILETAPQSSPSQTSVGVGPVPAQVAPPSPPSSTDLDYVREAARTVDDPIDASPSTRLSLRGNDVFDETPVGARAHAGSTPPGPPPDMIGPSSFGARKRAATLSPAPQHASPTVPPSASMTPTTRPGPAPTSGLAEGPISNTTLIGSHSESSPLERRRAPTVPSNPPLNQPKQSILSVTFNTTLAPPGTLVRPADPAAWNAGPAEPRRMLPGDFGSRVAGLPAEPPGTSNINDTLRGPNPPTRLPASPEAPPKFPAAPSLHPDASAPNLPPAAPGATPSRLSGPPEPVELDNATTNPPPLRRGGGSQPPLRAPVLGVRKLPGILLERDAFEHDAKVGPVDSIEDDLRVTAPRTPVTPITYVGQVSREHQLATDDAGVTEPSMPRMSERMELPLRAPPTDPPKTRGLAERVDAALDEWGLETPVAPPSRAELRSLLGVPDVTKQQSLDDLERLNDRARELDSDPAIFPPRAIRDTHEVDPDDIEASIEVAPRARTRSVSAIGVAKPKKSE